MATAFQCTGFQNTGFQTDCKKRSGESKYYPVTFEYDRLKDEELVLSMFVAARNSKKRGKMKIV